MKPGLMENCTKMSLKDWLLGSKLDSAAKEGVPAMIFRKQGN